MAIIYDISELAAVAGTPGEVVDGNLTLSKSGGTIISGYVKDSLNATVGDVAVNIYQNVASAGATLIGECVSNSNGLYMFGILEVGESTVYTADANGYTA